jgi:phage tail-like protein
MTAVPPAIRAWTLDAGTDWHARVRANLDIDVTDALTIRALTGRADPLPAGGLVGLKQCPTALTADCDGTLVVLDAGSATLGRVGRRCEAAWVTVGGDGTSPRQFRSPRGVALLPSGALAVADTGNHRVQVFAPATETLVHSFGRHDRLGAPRRGSGPLEFDAPWDVAADRRGHLFVADRDNQRIQVIAADGQWRCDLGADYLQRPVRLALSPSGALAVVDSGLNVVLVFTMSRKLPRMLRLPDPTSVAFGRDGRLFVGDRRGSVHSYAESPSGSGRYELVGTAATGITRPIVAMAVYGQPARLALIAEAASDDELRLQPDMPADDAARTLWTVDMAGGRALEGSVITDVIDSGRDRHRWQRVRIDAEVPRGTTVRVESATADDGAIAFDQLVWNRCIETGANNPDCLVQSAPGRYLWLKVVLRSNGRVAPSLRRITVSLGTSSYLQYLPAVFQEDEESRRFLERFLAIFQSGFDDLGQHVETLASLFDAHRTRARFLPWLAQWIGLIVDPAWSEAELRSQVAGAVQRYGRRGTVDGLQDAVRAYANVETRVVEHYRLRQLARLGETSMLDGSVAPWSPAHTQRLQLGSYSQLGEFRLISNPEPAVEALAWGAHRFTVLFDADPYSVSESAARVARVVERDKPAHTDASICPVFARMRLDVQARLDIDASVGDISYLVLNRLATLNYDSILGCTDHERTLSDYGTARRPRLGSTTRLA